MIRRGEQDSLRLKVETELEMARSKIDAIVKRIEQQRALLADVRVRCD